MGVNEIDNAQRHYDALADTGEAYTQHYGWTLTCLWCGEKVQGKTKAEALGKLQTHYDDLVLRAGYMVPKMVMRP